MFSSALFSANTLCSWFVKPSLDADVRVFIDLNSVEVLDRLEFFRFRLGPLKYFLVSNSTSSAGNST